MKKQYKCSPEGCQAGGEQHGDPAGAAPGEILITNWIDREGRFLPQDMRLWKAERESRALGTRSGNCLYVRVSNCSSIERIRTWDANVARIKGEKIRLESHHRRETEAEPGGTPWDGRQGDRPFLGGLTHFHPSFPQVTSGIWTEMEGGDTFRSQWSMVQNRYRHLLVKIFLTQDKKITRLKREIKAKLCSVFVYKKSPLKGEKWRASFCFF